MAGRDLSAELFGDASAGGRDLSAELFGNQPSEPVSRTEKLLRGMKDPLDGAAQLFEKMMPDSFNNANRSVNNWIADKTGMLSNMPENGVSGLINQQEADYQAKRAAAGESGFDGYRVTGNVLSPANLVTAAKLPQAASLLGRIGVGAAGGAASSALNPVIGEGDYWTEKAKQVGTGAAFGGAMAPITGAVARLISPNASTNANVNLLKNEGVKPTIGQTLGGWANSLEEKAQSWPIVGDMITGARKNAKEQFNNAAINRATGEVNISVKGYGTDAVKEAGDQISSVYTAAKAQLGNFAIDKQAAGELASLKAAAQMLPKTQRKSFNDLYDIYKGQLTPQGHLLPDGFKTLDSKLTDEAATFMGSSDAYHQKLGTAITELKSIIFDNAKRANPAAAELLDKADSAWANVVRVEGASKAAKLTDGVFTPGQLLGAVKGADTSVRDRATARGTALMQDLATAGQSVLGNKIPDSGTAGRLGWGLTGAAAATNLPLTVGGLLGGAAAYTSPMQSLFRGLVSSRPESAQAIAEAARKTSPYFIPAGAQIGLGLLNQ